MKKTLLTLSISLLSFSCFALNVYIPDDNFLNALIEEGVDLNNDGKIQLVEAEYVTKKLDVRGESITDLTGIKAFTNLEELRCDDNELISLDVSDLSNLEELECDDNELTSLDVSGLSSLTHLRCGRNKLPSLDVSSLSNLTFLSLTNNKVKRLDVSASSKLGYLKCDNNELIGLHVSGLSKLRQLYCNNNELTSLNVSDLSNLHTLNCKENWKHISICVATSQNTLAWEKDVSAEWKDDCAVGLEETVAEQELTILKAYNLQGQEVPLNTTGEVIILLFDNGTREKTYVAE